MTPIHTLNARGNIFLEVMQETLNISSKNMRNEIKCLHAEVISVLKQKGIDYNKLRAGLVPSTDKHEAAFIFDSTLIKSSIYGREVMLKILPKLEPKSVQSVLCGDLLGDDQTAIEKILRDSLVIANNFIFKHSTLLYTVYVNNLTEKSLTDIHTFLKDSDAYVGYIPTTNQTLAKSYVSLYLVNVFLKVEKTILLGHEDDRPNEENCNLSLYPFEEMGFKVVSLKGYFFDMFLSYKIERPVVKPFEADTKMAINSISDVVDKIYDFSVEIEDAKHKYLLKNKIGSMTLAGLHEIDKISLEEVIRSKLSNSYIYNLKHLHEHNTMLFNIIVEIENSERYAVRLLAALEYKPILKVLRLVTLY